MYNKITLLLFFLCSLLTLRAEVFHTGSPDSGAVNLKEVVVSDFRMNKRNLAPAATTVIDHKALDAMHTTSLKELTAVIPNFFMPDYAARTTAPVYIRGIGMKSDGTAVAFYVDGVPYYEPITFETDLGDIGAVEVLRGPQGTLFGRNAIGGIINIHTLSPLDWQGTKLRASLGNHQDNRFQFSHYRLLSPHFGLALGATYHHNGGYFFNQYNNRKTNKMDETEEHLGLYWNPSGRWSLRLTSRLAYNDQGGYSYAPYDTGADTLAPISYNRLSGFRRLVSTTGLGAHYAGRGFSLNSQTSFQYLKSHQWVDQDYTTADKTFLLSDRHQHHLSQEFTAKSDNQSRYQWVAGAFFMYQHVDRTVENAHPSSGTTAQSHYHQPTTALALYHQSSINLWRGLSVAAGLRYDYEHTRSRYTRLSYSAKSSAQSNAAFVQSDAASALNDATFALSNAKKTVNLKSGEGRRTADFNKGEDFHQFTPKLSLQYLTTAGQKYYFALTRGYKPGGFNRSIAEPEHQRYNPEYSWNWEVGTSLSFFRHRLTIAADIFYIDWRHMQLTYTYVGIGTLTTNAGHADSRGAELSISATPIKNVRLDASYGYTYARFVSYRKSEGTDYSHNRLPMVPTNTLSLNLNYSRAHLGWLDGFEANIGLQALGPIRWAEDNIVRQDFYALLNASLSARKSVFTLELWAKNITATRYLSNVMTVSTGTYAQKGKPFLIGAALKIEL